MVISLSLFLALYTGPGETVDQCGLDLICVSPQAHAGKLRRPTKCFTSFKFSFLESEFELEREKTVENIISSKNITYQLCWSTVDSFEL